MLFWVAIYVGLGVLAAALVRVRREPTIVRGDRVFLVTVLYVALATVVTLMRGHYVSLGAIVVASAALLGGWFLQTRWWVVGAGAEAVTVAIDECAARLCAPAVRAGETCTITVPGGAVRLRVAPVGRSTMIEFVSTARHRKVQLFRRLLAKQYRPAIPTIRLGVLGAHEG